MKTTIIRILGLMLVAMPMMAVAQNNIKSAFDAIIKCPEAQITEAHTLDKDPYTGKKTGQSDVYHFILPSSKAHLLEKVVSAFNKDAGMAYSVNRGKAFNSEEKKINLVIGNGEDGVQITSPDYEYIYSLFLAPLAEDADGIYRYAYGMNYKKETGELMGKLVITYATTLKYRQQMALQRQYEISETLMSRAHGIPGNTQETWFDMLMSYFQSMTSANSQTRIALASKAYKVIRDTSKYPEVTETDKDAIREILKGMISDKKYSETVLNKLLNQCLAGIK